MMAFRLTLDQLEVFYEVCTELKAETETQRLSVLKAMAELGQVEGITATHGTKEEYIKHLSEKFGDVMVIKQKEN